MEGEIVEAIEEYLIKLAYAESKLIDAGRHT